MKHAMGAIFKDYGEIKNPAYRKSPTGLQPEPDSRAGAKVGVQTAVRSSGSSWPVTWGYSAQRIESGRSVS